MTGNVDHVFNGTSGITGQSSLLVNMNSFGTLTVSEPFTVDLSGSGGHGLLLQGIGIVLEEPLTSKRGGRWSAGTISGGFQGALINEAPLSDPFRIVPGASKTLNQSFVTTGATLQSATVLINDPIILWVGDEGTLSIEPMPTSVDWNGNGEIVNGGLFEVQGEARSTISTGFSQTDGGTLRSEGELVLRGGGTWSGNTATVVGNDSALVSAVTLRNERFEFGSGTHAFVENGAFDYRVLDLDSADLITTAADAVVTFDLRDEPGTGFGLVGMSNGGLGGSGRFENRGDFAWVSGEFGADGMIDFTNANSGLLEIANSGNLLDGRLHNQGSAFGGVHLTGDAVVENGSRWVLDGETIGATELAMPGLFNNVGNLVVLPDGSESRIDARLDNSGTVSLKSASTLRINGPVEQLQDGVLSGGTWMLGPDTTLIFPDAFSTIGFGTVVRGVQGVDGIEALTRILGGEASVTGDLSLDGGLELNNGARITVDGQSSLNVPGGVRNGAAGQNGSITEMLEEALVIGRVSEPPDARMNAFAAAGKHARGAQLPLLTTPVFDNHAGIAPGGLDLPGPFNLDGDLVMHPGSVLAIDIAGSDPIAGHDLLNVTGGVELGGTIEITLAEDFTPTIGQQFVIATAADTSGSFDGIDQTNRKEISWSLSNIGNDVILTVVDIAIFADRFE